MSTIIIPGPETSTTRRGKDIHSSPLAESSKGSTTNQTCYPRDIEQELQREGKRRRYNIQSPLPISEFRQKISESRSQSSMDNVFRKMEMKIAEQAQSLVILTNENREVGFHSANLISLPIVRLLHSLIVFGSSRPFSNTPVLHPSASPHQYRRSCPKQRNPRYKPPTTCSEA